MQPNTNKSTLVNNFVITQDQLFVIQTNKLWGPFGLKRWEKFGILNKHHVSSCNYHFPRTAVPPRHHFHMPPISTSSSIMSIMAHVHPCGHGSRSLSYFWFTLHPLAGKLFSHVSFFFFLIYFGIISVSYNWLT